jgi:DNA-binding response OmpR family regulator
MIQLNHYRHILLIEDDQAVAHSLVDGLEEANF